MVILTNCMARKHSDSGTGDASNPGSTSRTDDRGSLRMSRRNYVWGGVGALAAAVTSGVALQASPAAKAATSNQFLTDFSEYAP